MRLQSKTGSNDPRKFCKIHRSAVALDLLFAVSFSFEIIVKMML